MALIPLIFLLLALLWVLYCFLPGGTPTFTPAAGIRCVIGLIVLLIVYLIVVALFGTIGAGGLKLT